jgi:hypothetical protein
MASIKALDPETGETKWEYKISRGRAADSGQPDRHRRVDGRAAVALLDGRDHGGIADKRAGGWEAYVAIQASGVLYSFGLPTVLE